MYGNVLLTYIEIFIHCQFPTEFNQYCICMYRGGGPGGPGGAGPPLESRIYVVNFLKIVKI